MMKSLSRPILVVDDDDMDADQSIDVLRRAAPARDIVRIEDGADAIDFLGRYLAPRGADALPAFILLDLKMPRQDGIDVLRFRHSHVALMAVPVVVFTSSADERDISRSVALGANAYVVKPLDPRAYDDAVNTAGRFWTVHDRIGS